MPVLITGPYIVIGMCNISLESAAFFLFLSFLTILGIAGYAYLLNDWSDEKKDIAAGKKNALVGMPSALRIVWLIVFLACALIPWFYFPFSYLTIGLLMAELLLFALYSFPPFRLKEKPIAGIVADALYAHALPITLAMLTFGLIGQCRSSIYKTLALLLPAILLWQTAVGLRNILFHQLDDLQNDKATNTHTFATKFGVLKSISAIAWFLKAEGLFALLSLLALPYHLSAFIMAAYLAFVLWQYNQGAPERDNQENLKTFAYRYLDDFYNYWLPLSVLAGLSYSNPSFLLLLLGHFLLLPNPIKRWTLHKLRLR